MVDLIFEESGRPDSRAERKGAEAQVRATPLPRSHQGGRGGTKRTHCRKSTFARYLSCHSEYKLVLQVARYQADI